MANDIYDLAHINMGLLLDGRTSPMLYSPTDFPLPEMRKALEILKTGKKEDVVRVMTASMIEDAHNAVKNMNGIGDLENFDWKSALQKASRNYELGKQLEKMGRKLVSNEETDLLPLYGNLTSIVGGQSTGLQTADSIDFSAYAPYTYCGYEPLDKIIGGVPSDAPIVVYGLTGVGKSHFTFNLVCSFLAKNPDKRAAIYTLEMGAEGYLSRELKMYPEHKKVMNRLLVSGSVRNIEQLVGEVTASQVDFVAIDDMDGLVTSSDASEYERVYRRVKEICRFLKIPVLVIGQPNRNAKLAGRFLNAYDVAWSGASENSAGLLIALQRVSVLKEKDWTDYRFPIPSDGRERYYIIVWKTRNKREDEGGKTFQIAPGAIRLEPSRMGYPKMWQGDVFENRLWSPNETVKAPLKQASKVVANDYDDIEEI